MPRSNRLPRLALPLLAILVGLLGGLPAAQGQLAPLADTFFSALGLENPFTSRAAPGTRGVTYKAADTWCVSRADECARADPAKPRLQLPRLHLQIVLLLRCASIAPHTQFYAC